jgi:hypothetical protein
VFQEGAIAKSLPLAFTVRRSPVSVFAITYTVDCDGVGSFIKKNPVITNAETKQSSEFTAELLYVTFTTFRVAM